MPLVAFKPTKARLVIEQGRESVLVMRVVVAKGERLVAERIKQIAREAGVPIFRDVGLARALVELGEGGEIPATVTRLESANTASSAQHTVSAATRRQASLPRA